MRNCISVISTLLLFACSTAQLRAGSGESGLAFLKLGPSARGSSLGDALAASVTGAAATYYNPAGLVSNQSGTGLMFTHREWIQDTRTENLAAGIRLGESDAFGLALNSTTISDIPIRTRPGTPEGLFTARNFSLSGSFAHAFADDFRAGVTVKFLYEKILVDEASGTAFDFGAQYMSGIDGLSFGLVFANLGSVGTLRNESSTLPSHVRIGVAYTHPLPELKGQVNISSDLIHVFPGSVDHVAAGVEFDWNSIVGLRAGYVSGFEGRSVSAGVGFTHGIVTLDYAFVPFSEGLGSSHIISLSVSP